jgi:predicted AAA+ superfamily ATPase
LTPRRVTPLVASALERYPAVLLEGPRTVGKSTLLSLVADGRSGRLLNLDAAAVRQAVRADPDGALDGGGLVCVDEYSQVPAVLQSIKAIIGQAGWAGNFLLAGSTRHAALPAGAQALTGRLRRIAVEPLAQSEIDRSAPDTVAALFSDPARVVDSYRAPNGAGKPEYISRALRGGLPLALAAPTGEDRQDWFEGYIALTLDRDARQLARIRHSWALPEILNRLAARNAQVLSVAAISSQIGLSQPTTREYISLLEGAFLVRTLPAWRPVHTARSQLRPKVLLVDSGVAGHLAGLTQERLERVDAGAATELGHLLEAFAVNELVKEASWTRGVSLAGYWRTYEGAEVDAIMTDRAKRVVAFKVKAARTASSKDFAGLAALRDALGDAFVAGVLLTTGPIAYTQADRLHVLPLDALWRPPAG